MADVSLPYSEVLTGAVDVELGQISNGLCIDLTSVAGTHSFSYFHTGLQDWVLLKAYTTTAHETIRNLNGKRVKYVATDTPATTVVNIEEIANVRNS